MRYVSPTIVASTIAALGIGSSTIPKYGTGPESAPPPDQLYTDIPPAYEADE